MTNDKLDDLNKLTDVNNEISRLVQQKKSLDDMYFDTRFSVFGKFIRYTNDVGQKVGKVGSFVDVKMCNTWLASQLSFAFMLEPKEMERYSVFSIVDIQKQLSQSKQQDKETAEAFAIRKTALMDELRRQKNNVAWNPINPLDIGATVLPNFKEAYALVDKQPPLETIKKKMISIRPFHAFDSWEYANELLSDSTLSVSDIFSWFTQVIN
jgi:hypothetical protein